MRSDVSVCQREMSRVLCEGTGYFVHGEHAYSTFNGIWEHERAYCHEIMRRRKPASERNIFEAWLFDRKQCEENLQHALLLAKDAQHRAEARELQERMRTASGQLAAMPHDILHVILDRCTLADVLRTCSVCKSIDACVTVEYKARCVARYVFPHEAHSTVLSEVRYRQVARVVNLCTSMQPVDKDDLVRLAALVASGAPPELTTSMRLVLHDIRRVHVAETSLKEYLRRRDLDVCVTEVSELAHQMQEARHDVLDALNRLRWINDSHQLRLLLPEWDPVTRRHLYEWTTLCDDVLSSAKRHSTDPK